MVLPHRDNPRVEPVENPGPEAAELLRHTLADPEGAPLAIFRTMAHHPPLLKRWNVIAGFFRTRGVLPARTREIVVLRTAWRINSRYEWGQHVLIAREAGLTEPEIARLARPEPFAPDSDDADALLVRFVDELVDFTDVTDPTWDALSARHTVEETFELVMLVGLYRMAGGFLNVTGVQPEPYLPTWPDDASASAALSTTGDHA
ncbi:carboxymuconolactone decarboxylase family protein [Pseudonocardia acidicola]|uniref:Carboxymuconolactone decarboxylase family protein n=1 Tax=Pseudonocardia acidicola TaxID=2724939 RepID=A0ABX1SEY6_9PSEU|nr:carboxymuconolactone decarboxylase family protein [Pseudonocardia acidicola]NMI00116.1 carboxymuconolactone decarboxylase family protein [Pseudonocardia acidicola]